MLMQMEVDKLQLQEDKLKATERMAEKELGVKSQYYDTLRRAMEQKGEIKPEVIGALIPSEITSGGESYKFDDSDKQAIFARALDLYKNNKGAGISYAIGKASDEFVQSTGKKPDVSFVDRIMSLFPGLD